MRQTPFFIFRDRGRRIEMIFVEIIEIFLFRYIKKKFSGKLESYEVFYVFDLEKIEIKS